jgi:hypothetical protein
MKDYYYILGVNQNASTKEIKDAYRKLSKKFHPDVNDGDIFFERRFKEIQEAYEYLMKLNNSNSTSEDNETLPQIIVFKTDKNFYCVGDTINLLWESIYGNVATINLFGNVNLSGNKQFIIKEPKDNLELILIIKNGESVVTKKVYIKVLESNVFKKNDSFKINYWFLIIPIVLALLVFREFNKNNNGDGLIDTLPESSNSSVVINNGQKDESSEFLEFYSSDPMNNPDDIDQIRLFNKPFNLLQDYYYSFTGVDEIYKVMNYYSDPLIIHHNDEYVNAAKAMQKDKNNFRDQGIESFRIFVQPNDMITDFYTNFDLCSTSVNFYIKKNNGEQLKIARRIYVILNKENSKILGISSKTISLNSVQRILESVNDAESNESTEENIVKMSTGENPYSYCYGNSFNCNFNCSQINVKMSGDADLVVIIKKDGEVYRNYFIEKGDSYSIKVPTGNYQPFFYSGNGWNPNKFIKNAECGRLIGGFQNNESIGKDEVQFLNNNVLSYELIPQLNGNFNTKSSNKNEAF